MSPMRAAHVCSYPGCPESVSVGRMCAAHARAVDRARGTAVERGYGPEWREISRAFLRANPWCKCGKPSRHTDHIVAKRDGGTDDPSNLQALCHSCHSRKTATQDSNFSRRGGV